MNVLSRYTKTRDGTNVENVTQKEYLESLASTALATKPAPEDYYQPFTYEEWYNRNTGIISGQEYSQYELYLKRWNSTRYSVTDIKSDIKADYVEFLKNLTLIVNNTESNQWLTDVNWDDNLEVEQVIPVYAKKLKEIAIYLINKRDALKKAKLKYNMTGATQALERLFYEYFLKSFTKRDYVLNVPDQDMYSLFPDLSAVNNGFTVKIEELYDDTSYFDKNPSQSSEFYFDTTAFNTETNDYYDSQNIPVSAYDWALKLGFNALSSDNPLFFIITDLVNNVQPPSAYIDLEDKILNEYYRISLSKKYIGENQYYATSGYYIPWTRPISYNLIQGNNWFYYPSGEYTQEANMLTIDPIALVNTNLVANGATGGSNYLSADKIFIRSGNSVSGAWLKLDSINTYNDVMSAGLFTYPPTIFKFPFPGFGVSGEDLAWSGPALSNLSKDFLYLDDDIKAMIQSTYWSNTTMVSAVCSINIHDTSLIDNGATAGTLYDEADNIWVTVTDNIDQIHDTTPDGIYQAGVNNSWLYKMDTTDIPINRGQNYINWPVERYDKNSATLYSVTTSQCAPMPISALSLNNSFVGARAGYNLFDSDIIYKLDKRNGTPVECAFLSGKEFKMLGGTTFTANATGIMQPALALNCQPNKEVTFIWTDETTDITDVNIQHKEHQSDCPYRYEKLHSLFTENPADNKPDVNYKQWQKCDCKAILYSPLGHSGSKYDDYKGFADVIYLDLLHPLPFNKTIWFGTDGKDYKHSKDFAWFKLDEGNEFNHDVGWGRGKWVTGDGSEFQFIKGQQYKYIRNDMGHDTTFILDKTVPNLIIKVPYKTNSGARWIKAVADQNGNWQSYNEVSDMVLNPAEYFVYDHVDSNWYCITGAGDFGTTLTNETTAINTNSNPFINYNYGTVNTLISLAWPNNVVSNGPSILANALTGVYWGVVSPVSGLIMYPTTNAEVLNIYAADAGSWIVNVTGVDSNAVKHIYNNVANFTIVPLISTHGTSGFLDISTIYADTINMSINVPLQGWNYTTHTYDGVSQGARPFWAKAYNIDNQHTKHKGIDVWGGGIRVVDDYVLITQPEFSDMVFENNKYLSYYAKNNLYWVEPLTFSVNITSAQWCDLQIDTSRIATLSSYLYNINKEMVVSASTTPSNLVLQPVMNELPVLVNYFATNAFTWSETLSDTSMGLPPTGGVYVNLVTGTYLEADMPYVNLTNRHYPTVATVPHVENLYSTEDAGGYFVPRMLGVSTALDKNLINSVNGAKIPNNGAGTNAFALNTNIDIYNSEKGISKTDQNITVENVVSDSSWMKSPVTSWNNAGNIVEASKHQQFIPYKTKYEITGRNDHGIHVQSDLYDPWTGAFDSTWENPVDWPSNFAKQYSIDAWYEQFPSTTYQVYQWKPDIFNNQYALLKPTTTGMSIYDKKHTLEGTLWVRNARNVVLPASALLSDIYNPLNNANLISGVDLIDVLNNHILDIDMYYDTLMFYTSTALLFFKLDLNYDTGEITSEINENTIIELGKNNLFGGTWLDVDKSVTICTLSTNNDQIYPILTKFDIDGNQLTRLYETSSVYTNMSAYNLTAVEHPVMTYNTIKQVYNISYIGYGSDKTGMYLNNINIQNTGKTYEIISATTIVPDA